MQTPFGEQRYERGPNGEYTMVTDIGDEGKGLVSRAVGLGMTDSKRLQSAPQLDGIAGALASRIGQRVGLDYGSHPMQLAQTPAQPPAKTQQQAALPQAQGLPQAPAQARQQGMVQ